MKFTNRDRMMLYFVTLCALADSPFISLNALAHLTGQGYKQLRDLLLEMKEKKLVERTRKMYHVTATGRRYQDLFSVMVDMMDPTVYNFVTQSNGTMVLKK